MDHGTVSGYPQGQTPEEERFAAGFIDGFTRAREIFWRDLMRRAGECRLMGESAATPELKSHFSSMEISYRNSADLISRSHTLYPGAIPPGASVDDPRFSVKFDEDLFRY
jgi:hypothetical protein